MEPIVGKCRWCGDYFAFFVGDDPDFCCGRCRVEYNKADAEGYLE